MGTSNNTGRIAKNTMALYFRMLLQMCISLYTARVILDALGDVDYGLYSVVGGVLAIFTFINGTLIAATQRFISYSIGTNDEEVLRQTVASSKALHLIFAGLTLLIGETIGLWVLNTYINIPAGSEFAANVVYQLSIISAIFTITQVPYTAMIIAYERMEIFAYASIAEAVIKLGIAMSLGLFVANRLEIYSLFMLLTVVVMWFIWRGFSRRNFAVGKQPMKLYKGTIKEMTSFASWNMFGTLASSASVHGINILINIFFGARVNTARAIAYQVTNTVTQFTTNLNMAVNPQITQSYASGNLSYMHSLIYWGCKISYCLLMIISIPLIIEMPTILTWWLGDYPPFTVILCQLALIDAMLFAISSPLITSSLATGRIKIYQIVVGGLYLLLLPIVFIVLKLGGSPQSTLVVSIIINVVTLFARLYMLRPMIQLSIKAYSYKVLLPLFFISIIAPILPILIHFNIANDVLRVITVGVVSVIWSIIVVYYIGLNYLERAKVIEVFRHYVSSKLNLKQSNNAQLF